VPSALSAPRPAPEPSHRGEAIAARELRAEQALRAGHEGARILVVEDNPVNQEVALTLLLSAGLQVDIAQDGHEAIEMARAGAYALILMDIQMPGIDGLEATRVLRQDAATARVPIIAMTANVQPSDCASCLAAGVSDHLPKPVEPVVLYDMLLRWLGGAPTGPVRLDRAVAEAMLPAASSGQLNTARGVAFFAGNQAVYATALGQFCTMYASGIDGLQACLDDRSEAHAEALRRELHSLRGASAALGAETFARQVHQLEDALRDAPDAAPIGPALNGLRNELNALIDEMRETATATAQAGSGAS
jgi:two-component system sensor histidine kinase/response regulator